MCNERRLHPINTPFLPEVIAIVILGVAARASLDCHRYINYLHISHDVDSTDREYDTVINHLDDFTTYRKWVKNDK